MFTQDEVAKRAYDKAEKFRRDQAAQLEYADAEGEKRGLKKGRSMLTRPQQQTNSWPASASSPRWPKGMWKPTGKRRKAPGDRGFSCKRVNGIKNYQKKGNAYSL